MANLRPITQRQFIVQISNLGSFAFTKATSPKETRETTDYNDGQRGTVYKLPGFTSRDNVTLSKPFYPAQDKALVTWYQNQKKAEAQKFTVSIQPVNADLEGSAIAGAGTFILTGCEVVSLKLPDVDKMGSGIAMMEVEILYDEWSYQ